MAKSSRRRSHIERLRKRWNDLRKTEGYCWIPHESLSFGRLYSQDPLDCGRPDCPYCSGGKVFNPKEERNLNKKELRDLLKEG